MITFDDVLEKCGSFGRYQKKNLLLVALCSLYVGNTNLATVFTSYIPNFKCREVFGRDGNETELVLSSFNFSNSDIKECIVTLGNNTNSTCMRWVYDESLFTSTTVSQFNMVCDRKTLRAHMRMLFMIGHLIGAGKFGLASDRFGRKRCALISALLQTSVASATALSPNVYIYGLLFCLSGVFLMGFHTSIFGLLLELIGKRRRFYSVVIMNYAYSLGVIVCSLFSYFVRDWRYFQVLSSLPGVLFVSYWWLLLESPRWLLSKGKLREASVALQEIARDNRKIFDSSLISKIDRHDKGTEPSAKLWHMFRYRVPTIVFFIFLYKWMVNSLLYYGLALNTPNLFGNVHINMVITGVVEIVATCIVHVFVNKIGRKVLYSASIIAAGIFCLATIPTSLYLEKSFQWLTTAFAMVGSLGSATSFSVVYLQTAEYFPTPIRSTAVGVSSMFARIGSIVSPYIVDIGMYMGSGAVSKVFPLMVFGIAGLTSGFVSLVIPETLGKPLPETFIDSIYLSKKLPKSVKRPSVHKEEMTERTHEQLLNKMDVQ